MLRVRVRVRVRDSGFAVRGPGLFVCDFFMFDYGEILSLILTLTLTLKAIAPTHRI